MNESSHNFIFRYRPDRHIRFVILLSVLSIVIGLVWGWIDLSDWPFVLVELGVLVNFDRLWSSQRVLVDDEGIRTQGYGMSKQRKLGWHEIHKVYQRGFLTRKFLVFDGGGSGALAVWNHLRDFEKFLQMVHEHLPSHAERSGSLFRKLVDKGDLRTNVVH